MKKHTNGGLTNLIADMKWIVTGLILFFLSCNGQKKSAGETAENNIQNSDTFLNLIASDSYSGTDEAETLIISDIESLRKFYSKINRTRKPGLAVPDVDFTKEKVIVRCGGKQNNSSIPELYVMKDSKGVVVIGMKNPEKETTTSAVTTPFSVYKIPITQKELIFKEVQ